ncbi:uncharacterized protein [Manis javanica]|uniref:uncharacterized protein n=1 Tax=Manis javanica TaxID=9974 RepID=UPI003C6D319A
MEQAALTARGAPRDGGQRVAGNEQTSPRAHRPKLRGRGRSREGATEWNPAPPWPRAEIARSEAHSAAAAACTRDHGWQPQRRAVEGLRHAKAPGKHKRSQVGQPECEEKHCPARPPSRPHPAALPLAACPATPRDHWPRGPSVRGGPVPRRRQPLGARGETLSTVSTVATVASAGGRERSRGTLRASVRRPCPPSRLRSGTGGDQMLMDPRSSGLSVCSAAPSSRYPCAGGTDLAPSLGSPPRARWAPGAVVVPTRLSRSRRRAKAVQVREIDPDFRPLARQDFSQSSSATSSRCHRAARPGTPIPRGTAFGLGGR